MTFFQKKCTLHRYSTADGGDTGAGERVMKGFLIRWEEPVSKVGTGNRAGFGVPSS